MADKNNSKGTWKSGDISVLKLVVDGKVVKLPKKQNDDGKKKGKK